MKNNIKKIGLIVLLFVSIFLLTACEKKEKVKDTKKDKETKEEKTIDSKLIGTWKNESDGINAVYVFEKDGTGKYTITVEENVSEQDMDYYTKDGSLFINFNKDPDTFEIEYKMENGNLIIFDSLGEELLFKKQ